MSDDLDLRAIDRRHEPDPRFVAALGDRLEAIMASPASADVSADRGTALIDRAGTRGLTSSPDATRQPPPPGTRWLFAAACIAPSWRRPSPLLWGLGDSETAPFVTSVVPDTTGPVVERVGGVDRDDDDGDIYLVRPGEDARRLEVAGSDAADDACPAWSPDGTRLLFGRVTGSSDTASSDAELVIVPVGRDGAAGAPTVIALDGFEALPGFDPHPCATWAPDGRWVAFAGSGEVWVVDTQTGAIRRLPDLRPSDLEWRPGTDELAIAGDMGPNRAAEYLVHAGHRLLRVDRRAPPARLRRAAKPHVVARRLDIGVPGRRERPDELWLVDADGANERLLADVGAAKHGIGPVWSPTGDRIAYQRLCCEAWRDARGRPRERCRWERDGHRATGDRRAERAGVLVPLQRHVVAGRHDAALHGVERR